MHNSEMQHNDDRHAHLGDEPRAEIQLSAVHQGTKASAKGTPLGGRQPTHWQALCLHGLRRCTVYCLARHPEEPTDVLLDSTIKLTANLAIGLTYFDFAKAKIHFEATLFVAIRLGGQLACARFGKLQLAVTCNEQVQTWTHCSLSRQICMLGEA